MKHRQRFLSIAGLLTASWLFLVSPVVTRARQSEPNPTPLVITLTPYSQTTTPAATPTPAGDRFEPNDTAATAAAIGFGTESELALAGSDLDYFTIYWKQDQLVQVDTYVADGLDTRLTMFWNSQPVAANDDRSPSDVGSTVTLRAPADGWYLILVEKATIYDGRYDLALQLVEPTPVPSATPTPTSVQPGTPTPTWTPLPTATPLPPAVPAAPAQPGPMSGPVSSPTPVAPVPTGTTTTTISLTVVYLGQVPSSTPATNGISTTIGLLVYYDANNDRQPGPGEGVPNVSVVAVDGQGQRLARVWTNLEGEAVMNLPHPGYSGVARVMVPFVPGWSARVQAGRANDGLLLGLPAVRLPVFLPVASTPVAQPGLPGRP